MKKFFVIGAAVSLSFITTAQTTSSLGVKGGVNFSNVKADFGQQYAFKTGLNLGLLVHIHVSPQFAVQPEVMFSQQGAQYKNESEIKLKLDYVNIPLLLQYMTGTGFRLETGPQLGFLTKAKIQDHSVEERVTSSLKDIDLSWSFGVGYLSAGGLGVDARYNHGITNINEDETRELRNRVIQLGLFYQFMSHTVTSKRKYGR